jgi:hypothetical protein
MQVLVVHSTDRGIRYAGLCVKSDGEMAWPRSFFPSAKELHQVSYHLSNIVPFLVARIAARVTNSDTSGTLPGFVTNLVNYAPASLVLSKPV